MLVSVIIPFYNESENLKKTIRSIQKQKYNNIEIILVDNASTDKSHRIAAHYQEIDSRIRLIYEPKKGVSNARKAGFLASHGEYIYFMDADDIAPTYGLTMLVNAAKKTSADVIQGDHVTYNSKQDFKRIKKDFNDYFRIVPCQQISDIYYVTTGIWEHLYKRSMVEELFFVDCDFLEDLLFNWYAYWNAKTYVQINQIVYFYNCSDSNGLSNSATRKPLDITNYLNILGEFWKDCLQKGTFVENQNILYERFISLLQIIRSYVVALSRQEKSEMVQKQIGEIDFLIKTEHPKMKEYK